MVLVKGAVGHKNAGFITDAEKKQAKGIELPMPAGLKQAATQQNNEAPAEAEQAEAPATENSEA